MSLNFFQSSATSLCEVVKCQFIQDTVSLQVANKLLDFLLKLRELGYPSHLADIAKNGLKCNVHADEADRMVSMSPKMQSSNVQLHFFMFWC